MKKTTFIISDDHPLVRKAIKFECLKNGNHEILGEAGNGIELLHLLKKALPDIIILDLEMPNLNGYQSLSEIKKLYPMVKIIVFSGYIDRKSQKELIREGVDATVVKAESEDSLRLSIEMVKAGKTYHSNLSDVFIPGPPIEEPAIDLTHREKEILFLIAKGYSSKEISDICCIAKTTANKHRSNLKKKIGAKNMSEIIAFAFKYRYIA